MDSKHRMNYFLIANKYCRDSKLILRINTHHTLTYVDAIHLFHHVLFLLIDGCLHLAYVLIQNR